MPPGAEGELFIGGEGVSQGYLGRPELTDERFLPNPFGLGKLYRTGDRVRWCSDGELEFLGVGRAGQDEQREQDEAPHAEDSKGGVRGRG